MDTFKIMSDGMTGAYQDSRDTADARADLDKKVETWVKWMKNKDGKHPEFPFGKEIFHRFWNSTPRNEDPERMTADFITKIESDDQETWIFLLREMIDDRHEGFRKHIDAAVEVSPFAGHTVAYVDSSIEFEIQDASQVSETNTNRDADQDWLEDRHHLVLIPKDSLIIVEAKRPQLEGETPPKD